MYKRMVPLQHNTTHNTENNRSYRHKTMEKKRTRRKTHRKKGSDELNKGDKSGFCTF